jgi:hypothetical protein
MHVAVIDQFGLFSGTKGDVVEVFDGVSKASNVKDTFGNNLFVQQRIRSDSDQVFLTGFSDRSSISGGVTSHSGTIAKTAHGVDAQSGVVFGTMIKPATVSLTGGTQGGVPSNKITNGYDQFEDSETVDVNILVGGGNTGADAISISNIASTRKDCIAFFSPPESAVLSGSGQNQSPKTSIVATANTVAYRRGENANESGGDVDFTSSNLNIDTSFSVMDSGWKLTFDRYNDKFRYIPLNADTAGVTVRTDIIAEPWFSPAGFNRGQVLGALWLIARTKQSEMIFTQITSTLSLRSPVKEQCCLVIRLCNKDHLRLTVSTFVDCSSFLRKQSQRQPSSNSSKSTMRLLARSSRV